MPKYRIYHLDSAGRVSSADWLDADGDQAAIEAAHDYNTLQCELWQGRRLVTRLGAAVGNSPPIVDHSRSARPDAESRA